MSDEKTVIIEKETPRGFLADHWRTMRGWWSVRLNEVGVLMLADMPAIKDQIPDLKQVLLGWFPRNGAQWVPIFCIVLTVVARVLSQAAVLDQLRRLFNRKGGDDGVH